METKELSEKRNLPCYDELTTKILDLVSSRGNLQNGDDFREGHDTLMHGIDDQANEIAKTWVAENIAAILVSAMESDQFMAKFSDTALNTPIDYSPISTRTELTEIGRAILDSKTS